MCITSAVSSLLALRASHDGLAAPSPHSRGRSAGSTSGASRRAGRPLSSQKTQTMAPAPHTDADTGSPSPESHFTLPRRRDARRRRRHLPAARRDGLRPRGARRRRRLGLLPDPESGDERPHKFAAPEESAAAQLVALGEAPEAQDHAGHAPATTAAAALRLLQPPRPRTLTGVEVGSGLLVVRQRDSCRPLIARRARRSGKASLSGCRRKGSAALRRSSQAADPVTPGAARPGDRLDPGLQEKPATAERTIKLDSTVRVRFAPSPTGELHIGSARTALFNWLFARHAGGVSCCASRTPTRRARRRGTRSRSSRTSRWLGLDWDEGPDSGGPVGPYRQSERLEATGRRRPHCSPPGTPITASAARSASRRCAPSSAPPASRRATTVAVRVWRASEAGAGSPPASRRPCASPCPSAETVVDDAAARRRHLRRRRFRRLHHPALRRRRRLQLRRRGRRRRHGDHPRDPRRRPPHQHRAPAAVAARPSMRRRRATPTTA